MRMIPRQAAVTHTQGQTLTMVLLSWFLHLLLLLLHVPLMLVLQSLLQLLQLPKSHHTLLAVYRWCSRSHHPAIGRHRIAVMRGLFLHRPRRRCSSSSGGSSSSPLNHSLTVHSRRRVLHLQAPLPSYRPTHRHYMLTLQPLFCGLLLQPLKVVVVLSEQATLLLVLQVWVRMLLVGFVPVVWVGWLCPQHH